jgi:uncharacterized protein YcbX
MAAVAWLSIAPVKGLALLDVPEIDLGRDGVAENRRFWIVDARGRIYTQLRDGRLALVHAAYDGGRERLELRFPDGETVAGEVDLGGAVETDFYGRAVQGRLVRGPWSPALSNFAGQALRLVRAERPGGGVDRGRGPVSLVSEASLEELGANAGLERPIDGRRFRMLVGVAGCGAHEEDEWCGRPIRLGHAVVHVLEPVARCTITTRNPDTGERDFDTLRAIAAYRGLRNGEAIDFGVYGEVVEPGRVRVGDAVGPLS